jgi:hypothetical protein
MADPEERPRPRRAKKKGPSAVDLASRRHQKRFGLIHMFKQQRLNSVRGIVAGLRNENSARALEFIVGDGELADLKAEVNALLAEIDHRMCISAATIECKRNPDPDAAARVKQIVRDTLGVHDADLEFVVRRLVGASAGVNAARHVDAPISRWTTYNEAILVDFEIRTSKRVKDRYDELTEEWEFGGTRYGTLRLRAAVGIFPSEDGSGKCKGIRARALVSVHTRSPAGHMEESAGPMYAELLVAIGVPYAADVYNALTFEWSFC